MQSGKRKRSGKNGIERVPTNNENSADASASADHRQERRCQDLPEELSSIGLHLTAMWGRVPVGNKQLAGVIVSGDLEAPRSVQYCHPSVRGVTAN
jgi:hypothetical protein